MTAHSIIASGFAFVVAVVFVAIGRVLVRQRYRQSIEETSSRLQRMGREPDSVP